MVCTDTMKTSVPCECLLWRETRRVSVRSLGSILLPRPVRPESIVVNQMVMPLRCEWMCATLAWRLTLAQLAMIVGQIKTPRVWRGVVVLGSKSVNDYFASHHQRPAGRAGFVAWIDSFWSDSSETIEATSARTPPATWTTTSLPWNTR